MTSSSSSAKRGRVIGDPSRTAINLQSSRVIRPCEWYNKPVEEPEKIDDIEKLKKNICDQLNQIKNQSKLIEKLKFKICIHKFEIEKASGLLGSATSRIDELEKQVIRLTKDNQALKCLLGL